MNEPDLDLPPDAPSEPTSGLASMAGREGETPAVSAGPDDWRAVLPDELRRHPQLTKFTSAEALARSYIHAERLIGSEKTPVPKNEADWDRWFKAAGRPDAADGYQFASPQSLPEGVEIDETLLGLFRASAHKAGLNQRQFDGVAGMFLNYAAHQVEASHRADDLSRAESEAALQQDWGAGYEGRLRLARQVARETGGEELAGFLDASGLGNHPALVRAFAAIGERIGGEDRLHGTRDDIGTSAADLDRAIADFRRSHTQELHDKAHPEHRRLVSDLARLYERRYPGEADG